MNRNIILAAAIAALPLTACDQAPSAAMQELSDKAAIEELLIDYYSHFGGTNNEDFAAYYTDDAVFDVNGIVLTGHEEIVGIYEGLEGEEEGSETQEVVPEEEGGQFHMIVSNIQVDVTGDTARAEMLWTGVMNEDPWERPYLAEQGREYDLLERQEDGRWLISHRVVIADSAMPESFRATYEPRLNFSFDAE